MYKRLSGCGSGNRISGSDTMGRFVSLSSVCRGKKKNSSYGNVWDGVKRTDICKEFKDCNVYAKEKCQNCFAKFYCSGGCAANSYNFHGAINDVYETGLRAAAQNVWNVPLCRKWQRQRKDKEN